VEDRLNAQDNLIDQDSGLSATERGDQYVNTILDDETNARYEGWKFRTELNALDTEYSASNRASLFTEEIR
jgi:hypothetical protein